MKKSTIAAIAAASVMGFGMAGNALALDMSGFLDIRYNAMEDVDSMSATTSGTGEEGNFTLDGEIDMMHEADGATVRIDLNLLNILNPNGGTDTDLIGIVEVEQANVSLPVPNMDMLTLTAGIYNSPFGYEGQDATDIDFAMNSYAWRSVPSNVGGAMLTVKPSDELAINFGWINSRSDISGGFGTHPTTAADRSNDMLVTANFDVNENIGIGVGYLTDNSKNTTVDGWWGNQIDAYVSANDLVPGLGLAAEYLSGDPATGSGELDSDIALYASYNVLENLDVAVRYEMLSYENGLGGTYDQDAGSLAVNLSMADNCVVRADYSEYKIDNGSSSQDLTIQMVHSF